MVFLRNKGISKFTVDGRIDSPVTSFSIDLIAKENPMELVEGNKVQFEMKDLYGSTGHVIFNGRIEGISDSYDTNARTFSITGRNVGLFLVEQPFYSPCYGVNTNTLRYRDFQVLLNRMLKGTGVKPDPSLMNLSFEFDNNPDSNNWYCSLFKTRKDALDMLFTRFGMVNGYPSNWFRWYVDINGYLKLFSIMNRPIVKLYNSQNVVDMGIKGKGSWHSLSEGENQDYDMNKNINGIVRRVSSVGETVTLGSITFNWDGVGRLYLTDYTKDSTNNFDGADDVLIFESNLGNISIDYSNGCSGSTHVKAPPEITSICQVGNNTITVKVKDKCGGYIRAENLYLINNRFIISRTNSNEIDGGSFSFEWDGLGHLCIASSMGAISSVGKLATDVLKITTQLGTLERDFSDGCKPNPNTGKTYQPVNITTICEEGTNTINIKAIGKCGGIVKLLPLYLFNVRTDIVEKVTNLDVLPAPKLTSIYKIGVESTAKPKNDVTVIGGTENQSRVRVTNMTNIKQFGRRVMDPQQTQCESVGSKANELLKDGTNNILTATMELIGYPNVACGMSMGLGFSSRYNDKKFIITSFRHEGSPANYKTSLGASTDEKVLVNPSITDYIEQIIEKRNENAQATRAKVTAVQKEDQTAIVKPVGLMSSSVLRAQNSVLAKGGYLKVKTL